MCTERHNQKKSSKETLEDRIQKKLLEASTWFKKKIKETQEKSKAENIEYQFNKENYKEMIKVGRNKEKKRKGEKKVMKNVHNRYMMSLYWI